MHNPRLATRYAKSLIDIAKEQNALDSVLQDMQSIHQVCKSSKDFTLMLQSPLVKGDRKAAIINSVFEKKNLQPVSKSFIDLLVNKSRETFLPEIAAEFINQYKEIKNINTVYLTTAIPLDEATQKSIADKIALSVNGQVDLHIKVDSEIIGGFILEVKDKAFDASIRRDLNDIALQFRENLFVAEI